MTSPPGGPHGQDHPEANPYGQGQYWGGPPQVGSYPPGGAYPYPQDGPYLPQGGPYPSAPGGADPYTGGAYPPQQFTPGGQQGPQTGWPAGFYPPGPPPRGPGSKTPWLVGAGIAIVIVALVVILALTVGHQGKPTTTAPSATTRVPTTPPATSQQNATDCTPNVSGGPVPTGDTVRAGKLSFPASAAPGWTPFSDDSMPNAIDAVGVAQEVPGANQWMMQAEVGITNFVTSMDIAAQASKLMTCVANGPGYAGASPTLGPTKTSSISVDGTPAARVDADITIADPSRNVKGDSVTIIVVKTKPATFFLGATPIGDADARATIDAVIAALRVAKN
ncbi:MAG: DUF3824 domain-containing protein [Mycobacterium sp.]|uniref:DUF3824 domain-containing protein n=1 Tax=Mycobacterium sp. TaxID=1785 RepID=UPI002637DC54|nr:DUF3824 domain-containing protein [Mycobacterium sp.]MDI3315346.1 DUF3824 domain-containing protein [Mycobacterium sp.]